MYHRSPGPLLAPVPEAGRVLEGLSCFQVLEAAAPALHASPHAQSGVVLLLIALHCPVHLSEGHCWYPPAQAGALCLPAAVQSAAWALSSLHSDRQALAMRLFGERMLAQGALSDSALAEKVPHVPDSS